MTLEEIEKALAKGQIYAAMLSGAWWRVRRNGKTQLWQTRPGHFRIPIKAGLRTYGELTHTTDWNKHFQVRL